MSENFFPALAIDGGRLARLEEIQRDEVVPSVVFQRLCEGEKLKDIAVKWQVPVGRFVEWFQTVHPALYDRALKVRADEIAHEALAISDERNEDVGRDKLRVETRLKMAAKWDRDRYGDRTTLTIVPPEARTPEEMRRQIAELEAKLGIRTVDAEPAAA